MTGYLQSKQNGETNKKSLGNKNIYLDIRGVCFDMDGIIFDTEPLYKTAWQQAGQEFGYEINDNLYNQFIGLSTAECEKLLVDHFGPDFPVLDFHKRWQKIRQQKIEQESVSYKPGFVELIQFLKARDLKLGLATSSTRFEVETNFKNSEYLDYFDCVITSEEVTRGKPDPEIYLLIANRLGVEPRQLMVLEDSINGMQAAIAAGTIAVMIPDMLPPSPDIVESAYKIFHSLNEVMDMFT